MKTFKKYYNPSTTVYNEVYAISFADFLYHKADTYAGLFGKVSDDLVNIYFEVSESNIPELTSALVEVNQVHDGEVKYLHFYENDCLVYTDGTFIIQDLEEFEETHKLVSVIPYERTMVDFAPVLHFKNGAIVEEELITDLRMTMREVDVGSLKTLNTRLVVDLTPNQIDAIVSYCDNFCST